MQQTVSQFSHNIKRVYELAQHMKFGRFVNFLRKTRARALLPFSNIRRLYVVARFLYISKRGTCRTGGVPPVKSFSANPPRAKTSFRTTVESAPVMNGLYVLLSLFKGDDYFVPSIVKALKRVKKDQTSIIRSNIREKAM